MPPKKTKLTSRKKRLPPRPALDPRDVYEDVYRQLTAVMDAAPQGPAVELAVLDAVIAASAHFAADCFNEPDAAAGALKCVQLFAERMRETLVAVHDGVSDPPGTIPPMTVVP